MKKVLKFVKIWLALIVILPVVFAGPWLVGSGIFFSYLSMYNLHDCRWEIWLGALDISLCFAALVYIMEGN